MFSLEDQPKAENGRGRGHHRLPSRNWPMGGHDSHFYPDSAVSLTMISQRERKGGLHLAFEILTLGAGCQNGVFRMRKS